MPHVFLDFEAFSYVDLKMVGSYKYAEDPTTEALCYAIAVDDSPVSLAIPDALDRLTFPRDIPDDWIFVAHNIEMEKNILRSKFEIDIPFERWIDTAALAARMSLPRSLEELALFFSLDVGAKQDANTARKGDSVCRPRPPSKHNPATRWTPATKPEAFTALYERCKLDVELCRTVFKRLLQHEENERAIWLLTMKMNQQGVKVDLDSIPDALEVLRKDGDPLIAEFAELTGGLKVKSYVKVAELLGMQGCDRPQVREALKNKNLDPRKRRILEIIQALSKASPSKLDAMVNRAHSDNRVRGSFLYAGAERTLRWSSSGVQFQNFKRGLGKEMDLAFRALRTGMLERVFDGAPRVPPDPPLTPTGTVAEMLKGFILGPHFHGDLAQIEARVIAWYAGDEEQLQLFRNKGDPYCSLASDIFGEKVTKADKERRFIGKQGELSCGFGVGADKFQWNLFDKFDVEISDDFSKHIVATYRKRHPKIVAFWGRVEKGFVHVVATKTPRVRVTRNLWMGYVKISGQNFAYIELPNGRKMYYADAQLLPGKRGPQVAYYGRDQFHPGWTLITTYGGKIAENVTQAFAREIIAAAMLRLDAAGYVLEMTVHDAVAAVDDGTKTLQDFTNRMKEVPPYAEGLPIEVDTSRSVRYQ